MENEQLQKLISAVLDDHLGPLESWQAERDFVRFLMQERAERKQMWKKVKESTLGHLAWVIFGGIGYVGWQVLSFVGRHMPEFMKEWGTK